MNHSSSKFQMFITNIYLRVVLLPLPYSIGNRKRKMMEMRHLGKIASQRNNRKYRRKNMKDKSNWMLTFTQFSQYYAHFSFIKLPFWPFSNCLFTFNSTKMRENDLNCFFHSIQGIYGYNFPPQSLPNSSVCLTANSSPHKFSTVKVKKTIRVLMFFTFKLFIQW